MATSKLTMGLAVLLTTFLPTQAFWLPEGFKRVYNNGFQRNYECKLS